MNDDPLSVVLTRFNVLYAQELYPSNIQDRLLNMKEAHQDKPQSLSREAGVKLIGNDMEESGPAFKKSAPIADLFPETTIMFCDLAGFTHWSSTRQPSEVFTLLETIFYEFDTIAKRRRVFKVSIHLF